MSKQVDTRAFAYSLEPILTQERWKLDQLQNMLGKAQRAVQDEELKLSTLKTSYQKHAAMVRESMSEKMDLVRYSQALTYITNIGKQIKATERNLLDLVEHRETARTNCIEQQKKIETIELHRTDCLTEFIASEQTRSNNEADRDWVARIQWQSGANESMSKLAKSMREKIL